MNHISNFVSSASFVSFGGSFKKRKNPKNHKKQPAGPAPLPPPLRSLSRR